MCLKLGGTGLCPHWGRRKTLITQVDFIQKEGPGTIGFTGTINYNNADRCKVMNVSSYLHPPYHSNSSGSEVPLFETCML